MGLKRRQRVEPEFSLAAMIDVIFLLLMFFMLTSKFVTPNALNLQLPSSSSTTMASPTEGLDVSIRSSGKFYIGTRETTPGNLLQALQAKIKATGKDPKQLTMSVVAETGAPIEYVVQVLDVANQLKVKTILRTDPKQ
jgi:biopolymer transport protein ExbD